MAVFGTGRNGSAHSALSLTDGQAAPLSILARGTRFVGTLETSGIVRVEGEVAGDLHAHGGQVLVAVGGVVEGDVEAALAVVAGEVHGHVVAEELVELKAGSVVLGDITTPSITVEEGGAVNGMLRMAPRANGSGRASVKPVKPEHPAAVEVQQERALKAV
jgi:cytoskeletal protein CcmA (bactofilin family)